MTGVGEPNESVRKLQNEKSVSSSTGMNPDITEREVQRTINKYMENYLPLPRNKSDQNVGRVLQ